VSAVDEQVVGKPQLEPRRLPTQSTATVPRRSFLRRAGVGAATALVMGDALLAYRAYDQGVLAEGRGPAFDAWASWQRGSGPESLVAAAILAASAHNTQPWLFELGDGRVDLYADRSRETGANDALGRELETSLGCALENLVLAARANGYEPAISVAPDRAAGLAASVALRSRSAAGSELYRAIGHRRSNRSEYTSDAVDNGALSEMEGLADDSAQVVWVTAQRDRTTFSDLLIDATRAHADDEQQSRASYAWWRGSWDEIQRRKDGLTVDGVGLRPLVRTIGKILPTTSRKAADRSFIDRTGIQSRSAAAFGIVIVDDPSSLAGRLAGGRLLERLHLWTTANDLGFQHMNQITERIDRDAQQGRPSPFEQPLTDLVGRGALAAFRVGVPTVAALPSPRRPAVEVIR
jgi:hypothetical protein